MAKVIGIIREEHRSIATVLQGAQLLLKEIRDHGATVDPRVFWAMLHYLDTFAERLHHPKEDHFLFHALKQRTGEAAGVIRELESEHARGIEEIRHLEQRLTRFQVEGQSAFPEFSEALERFIRGYREHMRKEEDVVLPLALKALSEADYEQIDRAFEENRDPLASGREEKDFRRLFERIVNLAPPPIGVGPAVTR